MADYPDKSEPPPSSPPVSVPPVIGSAPPLIPGSAPSSVPPRKSSSGRKLIAVLLSLGLVLFLVDGLISLADDSLILFFGAHLLAGIRGFTSFFAIFAAIVIYLLMALTPLVPKRTFLPLALFCPLALLALIPFAIYSHSHIGQVEWGISLTQVVLGLGIVWWLQRQRRAATQEAFPSPAPSPLKGHRESGEPASAQAPALAVPATASSVRADRESQRKFTLPLVAESQLEGRGFTWANLLLFFLGNIFILVPGIFVYLFFCAGMAASHFSEGFVVLRPGGLSVQTRKYTRADGKTIQLVPMAHVGERDFYRKVSQSFPTNAIILMEGVSDRNNLLTNKITYKRMATSMHLAEQQKEFKPVGGQWVRADVDVEQFTTNTIDFLNLAMRIHSKGVNLETVMPLLQYSPPPDFEKLIWDDLLGKRNRHLLGELQDHLADSDIIIVPWGAAHMPGISREIQASGFRLTETKDYRVIRFGPGPRR